MLRLMRQCSGSSEDDRLTLPIRLCLAVGNEMGGRARPVDEPDFASFVGELN